MWQARRREEVRLTGPCRHLGLPERKQEEGNGAPCPETVLQGGIEAHLSPRGLTAPSFAR